LEELLSRQSMPRSLANGEESSAARRQPATF
jgi:hypothetical protein